MRQSMPGEHLKGELLALNIIGTPPFIPALVVTLKLLESIYKFSKYLQKIVASIDVVQLNK